MRAENDAILPKETYGFFLILGLVRAVDVLETRVFEVQKTPTKIRALPEVATTERKILPVISRVGLQIEPHPRSLSGHNVNRSLHFF